MELSLKVKLFYLLYSAAEIDFYLPREEGLSGGCS